MIDDIYSIVELLRPSTFISVVEVKRVSGSACDIDTADDCIISQYVRRLTLIHNIFKSLFFNNDI